MRTTRPKAAAAARIGAALASRNRIELPELLRPCFARTEPWLQAGKYAMAVMSQIPQAQWVDDRRAGRGPRPGQDPAAAQPRDVGHVRRDGGGAPGRQLLVEQVCSDASSAPVSVKLKTLLAIAAAVQQGGLSVTAELVARARAADATDLEIHDTVLIAAAFCMFNRYVDGLAMVAPDDPALYTAGAQRLIKDGYLPPGEPSRQN